MSELTDCIKNKIVSKYNEKPLFVLFSAIMLFGIALTAIVSLIVPSFFELTVGKMGQHLFMDHFWSVRDSMNNPYSVQNVMYPALITLIYAFIGNSTLPFTNISTDDLAVDMYNSQIPMLVFILLLLLGLYILHVLIQKKMSEKYSKNETEILFFAVLFSMPVVICISNGNCILYTVIFCILFLLGYRSENKYIRYLSYICLGLAASMKIMPALFGLLILRDRRVKEFLICVAIVAVMVIVPFLFTDGSFFDMVNNALGGQVSKGGSISNITKMFAELANVFGTDVFNTIGKIVLVIATVLTILIAVFDRKLPEWKVITLIACYLIVGFGIGTPYLFIYLVIAVMFFLMSESEKTKENLVYVVFFGFCLMMITVQWTMFKSIFVLAIMLLIVYQSGKHLMSKKNDTECS